ncbi:MAG: hypothetical protein WC390_08560 [Sulfurimonas sp.]|jgi:hypothetical protein
MISLLSRINPPSNATPEVQDLCTQFNTHLDELEQHLASVQGSDGLSASLTSNLDLSGKRIKNAGSPRTSSDGIPLSTVKEKSVYNGYIRTLNTAKLKTSRTTQTISGVPNLATIKFLINQSVAAIDLSVVWPVGSVFSSVVATDPATLLGFGTWAAIATGQFIVGYKSGDSDFGTLEATGGFKTHTHDTDPASVTSGAPSATVSVGGSGTDVASATHTHAVDVANTTSGDNSALPPFFVLYLWKRTA